MDKCQKMEAKGQRVSVNLNRLMMFKLNSNVILVFKSSQSPLEILAGGFLCTDWEDECVPVCLVPAAVLCHCS